MRRKVIRLLPPLLFLITFISLYWLTQLDSVHWYSTHKLSEIGLYHLSIFLAYFFLTILILKLINKLLWQYIFHYKLKIIPPKILCDLVAFIVVTAVILFYLDNYFHRSVHALLATSGMLGIMFSIGIQDILSDFFAGMFLLLDNDFKIGDYIILLGVNKIEGEVVEMTWRYTRLLRSRRTIIVPNQIIASKGLINGSTSAVYNCQYSTKLNNNIPIDKAKILLFSSVKKIQRILRHPPINVYVTSIEQHAISYTISYAVKSEDYDVGYLNEEIDTNLEEQLRVANIPFPKKVKIIHKRDMLQQPQALTTSDYVLKTRYFEVLAPHELKLLIEYSSVHSYNLGESINLQSFSEPSLFLVLEGLIAASADEHQKPKYFSLGDMIGEFAFFLNTPETLQLVMETPTTLLEISRLALRSLLVENNRLLEHIAMVLIRQAKYQLQSDEKVFQNLSAFLGEAFSFEACLQKLEIVFHPNNSVNKEDL